MADIFDLNRFKSTRATKPGVGRSRKRVEPFVQVPWWWIERAANLTHSPATLVLMELLHAAWRAKSPIFPLPNARLQALGVGRKVKWRVLHDLERGRLITVKRTSRRTPIVTLVGV
jgi:hypothetical protein